MCDRTQEISLKLDNGELSYKDVSYLIEKVRETNTILGRIAIVSKNSHDNQHSINQALMTIKELTANFVGK